jgi:hypothetical protein
MKTKLNELRLDAGIARIENQQWLCVLDKETGMMIDPLIGLEKFAQLIVRECARVADVADENKCEWIGGNILTHFGVGE